MRVMLCDMPLSPESKFGKLKNLGSASPPVNILLLGTILKNAGHNVMITVDSDRLSDVAQTMRAFNPEVVGVTFMTLGSEHLPQFSAMVSQNAPNAILIAGGYHSTLFPHETLKNGHVDVVFRGEAEISLPAFIKLCAQGKPTADELRSVPGIAFLDYAGGGELVDTGPAPTLEDLDVLPFPDFDLIPDFFTNFHGSVNRHYFSNPQGFFLTSRGCPFNCHFCGRQILGSKLRAHSTEYLLELVEHCSKKYSIKSIVYGDEFFTASRHRTESFCERLRQKNLHKIEWSCSGRTEAMDYEFAVMLRQSGLRQILYGIESGSQHILDVLNKKSTVEKNRKAIFDTSRAGIETTACIILGSPEETVESLKETRQFVLSTPLSWILLFLFTPLPGSYFYNEGRYLKYGKIIDDNMSHYNCVNGTFVPDGLSAELLRDFRVSLYKSFYLRPGRLVKELTHVFNPSSWRAFFRLMR